MSVKKTPEKTAVETLVANGPPDSDALAPMPESVSVMDALAEVVSEIDKMNARIEAVLAMLKPMAVVAGELKPQMARSDITPHLNDIKQHFNAIYFPQPAPAAAIITAARAEGDET